MLIEALLVPTASSFNFMLFQKSTAYHLKVSSEKQDAIYDRIKSQVIGVDIPSLRTNPEKKAASSEAVVTCAGSSTQRARIS